MICDKKRGGTIRSASSRMLIATIVLALPGCPSARAAAQAPSIPAMPVKQLVTEAVEHELVFLKYQAPFVRYRMHTIDAKGDQVREVIQSKDGAVARLLTREHRALTAEEDEAERTRLQALLDDPEGYRKHASGDTSGKKMAQELIKLLPDAMIFTYVDGQPQRASAKEAEIVVDYKPDPAWTPPTMVSAGLTGIEGRMWLDAKTHAMVAMNGQIFHSINFGLGMVARIHEGGTLSLEQGEVAPGKWFFTRFVEHINVRALMVKSIHEDGDTTATDFAEVNPMPYQEAIHTLLAMPLTAQAGH